MKTKKEPAVKSKEGKRTRGYRLKPSTHNLIVKIQGLMHSDQDAAIAGACIMFYAELKKNGYSKQLK
jgi:predicted nuclease with RNAse H fold